MTLSSFIRDNIEAILNEWQEFAATIPSASGMDAERLRNDAKDILLTIALDMECAQSDEEQIVKSKGGKPRSTGDTAAESHGAVRYLDGFTLKEMVSEFRALRASVIRLWLARGAFADRADAFHEMVRFNEGIDQALTESIARFSNRLDRSRELFMGALGHDLRTPLHVILQSTRVLLSSLGSTEQQQRAASSIDRSAQHASRMVDDLLDVARTRLGGSLPLDPQETDGDEVCRRVVDDLKALHPRRELRYEACGDLKGTWDAVRLNQLLSNLVRNAIQHGDAASPVTVRAIGEAAQVQFEVHNFGPPIPPSKLPHIFEPMVRGEAGREPDNRSGSMGLGLYIACTIAQAHHGTLSVESTHERGTLFTARLPRTID